LIDGFISLLNPVSLSVTVTLKDLTIDHWLPEPQMRLIDNVSSEPANPPKLYCCLLSFHWQIEKAAKRLFFHSRNEKFDFERDDTSEGVSNKSSPFVRWI
jgi:hypothetical protein